MLYHVSNTSGIKVLEPRVSTHKKAYVYAIDNLVTGLLFGVHHDDFDFFIYTDQEGNPTCCECYPGALEWVYKGKNCSIYELLEEGFLHGMTSWTPEVVCEHEVVVQNEIPVPDIYGRLLEEEEKGTLKIRRFENSAEYKQMITKHVVDRLIRYDALKYIETDERFQKYFNDIIQALQGVMDGHLLCPERTIKSIEEKEWLESLVNVRPSGRQLAWQQLEFTAFFHYGINSFTDKEWGDGKEDISVFYPEELNTDQWCESLVDAEIKACIITAKHHDGFCLWDTKYTDHSVMHTPFGKDIVAELAKSCKKYGLKLGIYLSPWDRHEATYGQGKAYDDYFCNQLTELLTNYGELYTVWFDGACGEGPNGKRQVYDWERYYALIRNLQPNAVISISGPDVRWCGNEAGDCRESEWSVVPARLFSQKAIAEVSQQADDGEFREKKIDERDRDLGSREVIAGETEFIWYPAEVDTSIRPGWFYHESEDDKVRSLEELTGIYEKSVGGNSVLLLNIPPHRDGYLAKPDVERLHEIGEYIRENFRKFRTDVEITETREAGKVVFTLHLEEEKPLKYLILKEKISEGQRVEKFRAEVYQETAKESVGETGYKTVATGTTIGYQKFVPLHSIPAKEIRVVLEEFRAKPMIESIRVS